MLELSDNEINWKKGAECLGRAEVWSRIRGMLFQEKSPFCSALVASASGCSSPTGRFTALFVFLFFYGS